MKGGFITLTAALLVAAVGSAIAVSLLLLAVSATRTSLALIQSSQAKALANACADEALEQIHDDSSFTGSGTLTMGQGTCSFTVTTQGAQNRTATASGTVNTIVRKVKVVIDKISPSINVVSWQELADF